MNRSFATVANRSAGNLKAFFLRITTRDLFIRDFYASLASRASTNSCYVVLRDSSRRRGFAICRRCNDLEQSCEVA